MLSHAALLRSSLRAMPKAPLAAGGLLGLLVAAVPALLHAGLELPDAAMLSRVAAVTVALGAGFALDDPSARTTLVVPLTPLVRRAVRAVPVLVAGPAVWVAAAAMARMSVAPEERPLFPWGGLALEAVSLTVVALVLALVGLRFTDGERGSMVAAPGILLLVITAAVLPGRAALFLPPGHPDWALVHQGWGGLLAVGLAVGILLARGAGTAGRRFRGSPRPA